MTRRLLVLLAVFTTFGVSASSLYGDPPAITIDVPSPVTTSDSSGIDVTYEVKSHLNPQLDVTCTPTGGPAPQFSATAHFPVGDTTISCTDTADPQNSASTTVTVTLVAPPPTDTTAPTLTLPGNITAEATSSSGAAVSYSVSAADDTDSSPSINCDHASGSTFALGATTVTCTASDDSGNTSAPASFNVTVVDTTPPSLSLPGNITAVATSGAGAVVSYSASASDAVSGSVAVTCNPPSGSTFPIATTTVNCQATDGVGKTASGSFTVAVTDNGGPQFSNVPGTVVVQANSSAGSLVNYTAPSATDAIDGPSIVTCAPASGSLFPLGSTSVTCTAADNHGNSTSASFLVQVVDTTPPTLIVPADSAAYATTPTGLPAQGYGAAQFLAAAHASDLIDPNPHISNDAGEFLTVGVHVITFSASDASGNTVSKTATFEVRPMPPAGTTPLPIPPTRQPPANVSDFKAVAGDGRVQLSWQIPSGVDHVVIARGLTAGGDAQQVYTGSGRSYVDRGVTNGLEYRYLIVSVGQNGDRSAGVAAVALPRRNLLRSPKDGARLKKPPKLMWSKNSEAAYYNVQLFRGNVKILSIWPLKPALALKRTWKYQGRRYTLTRGTYRWYVWPGFGARAKVDYGEMLGARSFQITR